MTPDRNAHADIMNMSVLDLSKKWRIHRPNWPFGGAPILVLVGFAVHSLLLIDSFFFPVYQNSIERQFEVRSGHDEEIN